MELSIDSIPAIFFILSLVVLIKTKKDLALWCSGGFLLSYLVDSHSWPYESSILAYSCITIGVASISAIHFKKGRYPLSLAVCLICILMLTNHLAQMVEFSMFSYWVSVVLGIAMLLSLWFIPGRKEWQNDMAVDIRMYSNSSLSGNGHHNDGGNI